MLSDLDIFRSAAVLIEHHGADAKLEAARRADAMLAKGDIDGYGVWLRIVRAIDTLQHAKGVNDEAKYWARFPDRGSFVQPRDASLCLPLFGPILSRDCPVIQCPINDLTCVTVWLWGRMCWTALKRH